MKRLVAIIFWTIMVCLLVVIPFVLFAPGKVSADEGPVYREVNPTLNIDTIRAAGVPTGLHVGEIFWGYSLPIWSDPAQVNEELHFMVEVPNWWTGDSDILIHVHTATTGDESGNTYGVQLSHSHSTPNVVEAFPAGAMHSETTNRLVSSNLTYAHYMDEFTVAYDHMPADPEVVDDVMGFRIRSIDNELQGKPLDGEIIIIDCVEVYFEYKDTATIINDWMEENMEEIGVQFAVFNGILAGWASYFLFALLLLIVWLAYWHRERWLYVLAGLALLLGGFSYWNDSWTLSILITLLGMYTFMKAFWQKQKEG